MCTCVYIYIYIHTLSAVLHQASATMARKDVKVLAREQFPMCASPVECPRRDIQQMIGNRTTNT